MTRPCSVQGCRREAAPEWGVCFTDAARILSQAFGPKPERRATVRRLSAAMPELQIAGRR